MLAIFKMHVSSFFVSLSYSAGIAKLFVSVEEEQKGMISQKVIVGWFIESQIQIIARESIVLFRTRKK